MPKPIRRNTGVSFSDIKNTAQYKCPGCKEMQTVNDVKSVSRFICNKCEFQTAIEG